MTALVLRRTDPPGTAKLFSMATRARLLTQWPHAGIVVGNELMHATLAMGLHSVLFEPAGWDIIELPEASGRIMVDRFMERRGAEYDAFSLLAFVLPGRVSDSKRMYCYEWCWYAMTGANPSWRVTPEQLLWCAYQMNRVLLSGPRSQT